jgi:actin-like ATPase involved in cell morphogenesis
MGLFWTDMKLRVTEKEWQKVRSELAGHNFTEKERDRVEEIFRADMYEEKEKEKGISEEEINKGIAWMREHVDEHHISETKIDILERELRSRL